VARSKLVKSPAHTVDPRDEPSAEWGWHGSFPRATRIAGWIVAAAMFLMLIGNHENNTENVWLIGIGCGLIILLGIDHARRRTSWRR
jgi:uncharacterized protein DUF2631